VAKHEFGLDEEGNKHCMVLKFEAAIFNLNLRDKMAIEAIQEPLLYAPAIPFIL
jgi:hypothetical protein